MTNPSVFTPDEWALIVQVPRWVVNGSSAAGKHNASRTRKAIEAGFIAIAEGRSMANDFVREAAEASMDFFDTTLARTGVNVRETEPGTSTVLERVASAALLLRTKADPPDSAAYATWIVTITDIVLGSGGNAGPFGFGGLHLSGGEKEFRQQLQLALQA